MKKTTQLNKFLLGLGASALILGSAFSVSAAGEMWKIGNPDAKVTYTTKQIRNHRNIQMSLTPISFDDVAQKWNYRISWDRRIGFKGELFFDGKVVKSGVTGVGSWETGAVLNPGTSHKIEFWSVPGRRGDQLVNYDFVVQPGDFGMGADSVATDSAYIKLNNATVGQAYSQIARFKIPNATTKPSVLWEGLPEGIYPATLPSDSVWSKQTYSLDSGEIYKANLAGTPTVAGTYRISLTVVSGGKEIVYRYLLVVGGASLNNTILFPDGELRYDFVPQDQVSLDIPFDFYLDSTQSKSFTVTFDGLPNGVAIDGIPGTTVKKGVKCDGVKRCSVNVSGSLALPGYYKAKMWISNGGAINVQKDVLFVVSNDNLNLNALNKALPDAYINFDFSTSIRLQVPGKPLESSATVVGLPKGITVTGASASNGIFTVRGNPAGSSTDIVIALAGKPQVAGDYPVTITVNANGVSYSKHLSLSVKIYTPTIEFVDTGVEMGLVDKYLTKTISFRYNSNKQGTLAAYVEKLPPGVWVDGVTNRQDAGGIVCAANATCSFVLSGVPKGDGDYSTRILVSDQNGVVFEKIQNFSIKKKETSAMITDLRFGNGFVQNDYAALFKIAGNNIDDLAKVSVTGLPDGVTLDGAVNGVYTVKLGGDKTAQFRVSGRPVKAGIYTININVEIEGAAASQQVLISIQ